MGQKVYVTIWKDRHADTTAHVFSTRELATDWARAKARQYDRHGEYEEKTYPGWLFYASYSCEGCCLYVTEREIDEERP